MARFAERVHAALIQKVNICRAMGRVARRAALDEDSPMLIAKWAGLFGVTPGAHRIFDGDRVRLIRHDSVRIVTA
jgi:hypothetical protein